MSHSPYQRIDNITKRVLEGGSMTAEEGRWMIRLGDEYLS